MLQKHLINPLAVIFLPKIDQKNNFTTIVFNPQTEKIIKVNRSGYKILKVIDENPGITLSQIVSLVSQKQHWPDWQNESKIIKFLDRVVKENIVFKKWQ